MNAPILLVAILSLVACAPPALSTGEGPGPDAGEGEGEAGEGEGEGEGGPDGENCGDPIDLATGGIWKGNLEQADEDVPDGCIEGGHGEHVIRFEVPDSIGQPSEVRIDFQGGDGFALALRRDGCVDGWAEERCIEGEVTELYLDPGVWYLLVQSTGDSPTGYEVHIAVRDPLRGECLADTDEASCADFGRTCSQPIDLQVGGRYEGELTRTPEDSNEVLIEPGCGYEGSPLAKVIVFHVPERAQGGDQEVRLLVESKFEAVRVSVHGPASDGSGSDACNNLGNDQIEFCFSTNQDQWFEVPPGLWFLTVSAPVDRDWQRVWFAVSIGVFNRDDNSCYTPDYDGDDITICDGDCDDGDRTRGPHMDEDCGGGDPDCSLRPDDLHGDCPKTGLPGVCGRGWWVCGDDEVVCEPRSQPGGDEICGDNLDNDCDGDMDEAGDCQVRAPGETCALAKVMGPGGVFEGDLSTAIDDIPPQASCGWEGNEHVLSFRIGGNVGDVYLSTIGSGDGVEFTIMGEDCLAQWNHGCMSAGETRRERWGPGLYHLIATFAHRGRASHYRVTFGVCNRENDNPAETCAVGGQQGLCSSGFPYCVGAETRCEQRRFPVSEVCGDGQDNDCDGDTDEDGCQ